MLPLTTHCFQRIHQRFDFTRPAPAPNHSDTPLPRVQQGDSWSGDCGQAVTTLAGHKGQGCVSRGGGAYMAAVVVVRTVSGKTRNAHLQRNSYSLIFARDRRKRPIISASEACRVNVLHEISRKTLKMMPTKYEAPPTRPLNL